MIILIERRSGTGTYLFMFVWQDKIIIFTGSGATLHTGLLLGGFLIGVEEAESERNLPI